VRGLGILLILLGTMASARAETLITSLSNHRVLINSNYTGTLIAVFGAIERDAQTVARGTGYDVVVTVRGDREPSRPRRSLCPGPPSARPARWRRTRQ
jgi:hypothetical protein